MLLLTESTLRSLNLIWNISATNKRAALLGRFSNWADDVRPSSGIGTPHNSVASDSQTNSTCHPLSSTVPSSTTKATGINSATSDKDPAHNESCSTVLSDLPVHNVNEDSEVERTAIPVQNAGRHKTKVCL